ncbi:alpha-hydroxy acid oxidase [Actinophytocola oryzae]|uniref:4-hydroxymandelate oxidase n=1 Tax=Actinophytocola oryzae TaxID=502181 RepID=A0A4V6Q6Z5_9PSEU|nr:alpha-hydroxy acid oxidase [Actinophytocola oryzae]TDV56341.1 4-hydroxymandelate oxidase [Actinophytocola oryzae]
MDVERLEEEAARILPAEVRDFVAGGADDEVSLAANVTAFRRRTLAPRVLTGASVPSAATMVLGCPLAAPVLVAPMGMQRLVHPDGEAATSAAAAANGLGFVLATGASVPIEEVGGPARLFQLYLLDDRGVSDDLVRRAVDAGYRAIVLTVDAPVIGNRPRDRRTRGGTAWRNANFEPYPGIDAEHHAYVSRIRADITWADVDHVVATAGVPVVVKGVLRPDDAVRAADHGAAGVVVSNHGGRQLGRAAVPIDVLESVVDAVGGRVAVLLDGGVRRPADVLTAVALGADAVLVGRLAMWALAAGGEAGVTEVLGDLVTGIHRTMTLLGARTLNDLTGVVTPTER